MDNEINKKQHYWRGFNSFIAFGITLGLALILFFMKKLASPTADELNILYYFRGVLTGKNGFVYTFSKGFGDVVLPELSLNAFDPLNLVYAFVKPSKIEAVYGILVAVRMALASASMSIYLYFRFKRGAPMTIVKNIFIVALSVSYSMTAILNPTAQFTLGMVMFPMISWGVYRIARGGRTSVFIISMILTGLMNWHLGFIAAVYSFGIFIAEVLISTFDGSSFINNRDIRAFVSRIIRYAISIVLTFFATSIIWKPVLAVMGKSSVAPLAFGFTGDYKNFFEIGALILVGCAMGFASSKMGIVKKAILAILVILTFLEIYCTPFINLLTTNGLVKTDYSFIGMVILTFIAGHTLLWYEPQDVKNFYVGITGGVVLVIVFLVQFLTGNKSVNYVSLVLLVLTIGILFALEIIKEKNNIAYWVALGILVLIIPCDKMWNASKIAHEQSNYTKNQSVYLSLINSMKSFDPSKTRISLVEGGVTRTMYSESDYFYFDSDNSNGINVAGLPITSKYIITDGETDQYVMGSLNQYKIIQNKNALPIAFKFDGNEFISKFNSLDEEHQAYMTADILRNKVSASSIREGSMSFKVTAEEGEKLFIAVPYDTNWYVENNGEEAVAVPFDGNFMMVDLKPGENSVKFTYELPGVFINSIISLVALGLASAFILSEQKKIKVSHYEYIRNFERP